MKSAGIPEAATVAAGEKPPRRGGRRIWWISAGLALFGLLPGLARLMVELAGGAQDSPAVDSSTSSVPVVVHIVSGTAFAVLGAFQFPAALRTRRRTWHRRVGRLLAPVGLAAAASALWLALWPQINDASALLTAMRLSVGTAMVVSIVVAVLAIRRRQIARHRDWMIRAYALALGAATQIFTLGFGGPVFGRSELAIALLTGAGWVINLAVAEWVIRRRFHRRPRRTAAGAVPQPRRRPNARAAPLSGSPH